MSNNLLSIGMLLSPQDYHLLPAWLESATAIGESIIIGIDDDSSYYRPPDTSYHLLNELDIFQNPLNNDFATARNKIIERCKTDWILFLDADELINPMVAFALMRWEPQGAGDYFSLQCWNLFNRRWVHNNTQARRLLHKNVRYINTSPQLGSVPGCHEIPDVKFLYGGSLDPLKYYILHLKENWTGNFRSKGYSDERDKEALASLELEIQANLQHNYNL